MTGEEPNEQRDQAPQPPPTDVQDPKRSIILIAILAFGFLACMCIFIAVVALLRATSL